MRLAEVVPFRGLRYNRKLVPDLAGVVAPPYDIISPARQRYYHDKHQYNAIRLEYGLEHADDGARQNRYTRAAADLAAWLEKKVLVPDAEPCFYFCHEEYHLPGGGDSVREGFIAAVGLVDFSEGVILPHERTHDGPKQDRLRLMEATNANLSPIYSVYPDADGKVADIIHEATSREPTAGFTDENRTHQTLWAIDDPDLTSRLSAAFSDRKLYIADGHHRYETALALRDRRRAQAGVSDEDTRQPYDYMLMYLSSMNTEGQPILPVHRFVAGLSAETLDHLQDLLETEFELRQIETDSPDPAAAMLKRIADLHPERNAFGMYLSGSDSFHVLAARRPRPLISSDESSNSQAWRSLDVAVLDQVILTRLLGIRPGGENPGASVRYLERTSKALHELDSGDYHVAFFLNPTSMHDIRAVADAGDKMPQKSTYFYPKPLTGLVFRSYRYG